MRFRTQLDRFESFVMPVTESGCWIWIGYVMPNGYAKFNASEGKNFLAHRWAYEQFRGPIPDGLYLDHLCRVRCCVNPLHLEAVTPYISAMRSTSVAAQNSIKTHCPKGHPYAGDNLWINTVGRYARQCRACWKIHRANRKAQLKGVTV